MALVLRVLEGRVSILTAFLIPVARHGHFGWPLFVMRGGKTDFAPADLWSAWSLLFRLLVISLWLAIRGPVSEILLEARKRQVATAFRLESIPAVVHSATGLVALLLRWGGIASVAVAAGSRLFLKPVCAVIAVTAVMPLAFSDFRQRFSPRRPSQHRGGPRPFS